MQVHWVPEIVSDVKIAYHNENIGNVNLSILEIL